MERIIEKIIVHCTASGYGRSLDWHDIDRMHRARGWREIGYHMLILIDGTRQIGSRELNEVGAGVFGFNKRTVHVAYVGGLGPDGKPKDTRSLRQRDELNAALWDLAHFLKRHNEINAEKAGEVPPRIKIVGHRDLSPDKDGDGKVEPHEWLKACPCFNAIPEYQWITDKLYGNV